MMAIPVVRPMETRSEGVVLPFSPFCPNWLLLPSENPPLAAGCEFLVRIVPFAGSAAFTPSASGTIRETVAILLSVVQAAPADVNHRLTFVEHLSANDLSQQQIVIADWHQRLDPAFQIGQRLRQDGDPFLCAFNV